MPGQADNRAPYAKIAAHYTQLIASGELQAGTLLPSIKALSEQWQVSTGTAEKALRKLRADGLVHGIHGIGTEVLDQPGPMSSGHSGKTGGTERGRAGDRANVPTRTRQAWCRRPMTWLTHWISSPAPKWCAVAVFTETGMGSWHRARHGFRRDTENSFRNFWQANG